MAQKIDPIDHVVVLMLENRSFDQMLGALKQVYGDKLDGVDPGHLYSNRVSPKETYQQQETKTLCIDPDPIHELKNVLTQIDKLSEFPQPIKIGKCRRIWEWIKAIAGTVLSYVKPKKLLVVMKLAKPYEGAFVNDFAAEYPQSTTEQRKEVMGYYPLDFLPALHALAREFTICDQWYSSLPGPTWPNRFFVHSGTSLGRVWMPAKKEDLVKMRPYDQRTVYDRLNKQKVLWRIYFGDIPQSLVLTHQQHRDNIVNYRPMSRFYSDAAGPEAEFPKYSFIEPTYFLSNANDDHPPHNTIHGQCLVADVYNALRSNEKLWEKTLLVIVYDEHGGFFDHVEPPRAVCPDGISDEYTFNRFGVRVPALLVSPWVKAGVLSTKFDHTSLIKYITEKWDLRGLGNRVAKANSIGEVFAGVTEMRPNTLPRIEDSAEMKTARAEPSLPDSQLNGNQRALLVFSRILAVLLDTPMLPTIIQALAPPIDEVDEAKQVVRLFVEQEQHKAGSSGL